MLDFEIQRSARHCYETQQPFEPGDTVYSVLVAEGAAVSRRDYSQQAWQGPPEGTIGWWKCQIPDLHAHRMQWAPNDVMLHYFEQLEDDQAQADLRYVLALLMIRRRIVRLEETENGPQGETFLLYCPRNEREYRVGVAAPTPQRIAEIQATLAELFFGHGADQEE